MKQLTAVFILLTVLTVPAKADWVTTTVPVGNYPLAAAVNPVTNRVYVVNNGSNTVMVIDGVTNQTTTVSAGTEPYAVAVNPVTNKIYVANNSSDNVTVIDGVTNDTTTVNAGSAPCAVAVNPVTNKIYVANWGGNTVTVIDGPTNSTTTVSVGTHPQAVAINPVTNKIYVANDGSNNITVIDGATNSTTTVSAGINPRAVAVNPVTNKIYVANFGSSFVTVIDGATNNTTTVNAGNGIAVALNPVTDKIYVPSQTFNNVTVITEVLWNDTKLRVEMDPVPGCTTYFAQPMLEGKAVNRWTPNRTGIMGLLNRTGTTQLPWNWATITSGVGTDSVEWSWTWDTDSLIMGENFVCCVSLEDQTAITNNLGLGTPFAGNLEVYPLYRMEVQVGCQDAQVNATGYCLSMIPNPFRSKASISYSLPRTENVNLKLYDVIGKLVRTLKSGTEKAGFYIVIWNGDDDKGEKVAKGIYFYRFEADEYIATNKMVKLE